MLKGRNILGYIILIVILISPIFMSCSIKSQGTPLGITGQTLHDHRSCSTRLPVIPSMNTGYQIIFESVSKEKSNIIIVDDINNEIFNKMTPATFYLNKNSDKNYTVFIKNDGYHNQEITLKREFKNWYLILDFRKCKLKSWLIDECRIKTVWERNFIPPKSNTIHTFSICL